MPAWLAAGKKTEFKQTHRCMYDIDLAIKLIQLSLWNQSSVTDSSGNSGFMFGNKKHNPICRMEIKSSVTSRNSSPFRFVSPPWHFKINHRRFVIGHSFHLRAASQLQAVLLGRWCHFHAGSAMDGFSPSETNPFRSYWLIILADDHERIPAVYYR